MKTTHYSALLTLTLLFALTACQKEDITTTDEATAALAIAESQEQVEDIDAEAAFRLDPRQSSNSSCPTLTWAAPQGTFPNTLTIDFGTGCTGFNGRTKSGQIIVAVSADHFTPGAVRTITPKDFSVDGFQIEGSRTITNQGLNASNQMYWTMTSHATVTNPEGESATWDASRTRTMLVGLDTPEECQDDIFQIEGTTSGINPHGDPFTSTITTPLVKEMDCRWPVSGVEAISVEGRKGTRTIDFGSGTCDDKATVTLPNGDTREITIRRRGR